MIDSCWFLIFWIKSSIFCSISSLGFSWTLSLLSSKPEKLPSSDAVPNNFGKSDFNISGVEFFLWGFNYYLFNWSIIIEITFDFFFQFFKLYFVEYFLFQYITFNSRYFLWIKLSFKVAPGVKYFRPDFRSILVRFCDFSY